jgi:cytoskeletal protein CcmA (bactofilin family)
MFERKNAKGDGERTQVEPAPAPQPAAPAPSNSTSRASGGRAMIGAKVKITGDIVSAEDLLIEGEVNGTVTLADHELVVGNAGRVHADVEAKIVRIDGEVQGDIVGRERVVISASGNVQGNVTAPRVVLEDGGRFKGSIDMGASDGVAAAKPRAAAATGKTEAAAGKADAAAGIGGTQKAS